MKRILLSLALVMGYVASMYGQTGQAALGVNFGVAPCLESGVSVTNFELGAKFQYGILEQLRGELAFDYGFKDSGVGVWTLGANFHYLLPVADNFHIYPLAGLGYGNEFWKGGNEGKFMFNVGLGGEYALTSRVSVGLEFKWQYLKDFNRMPILLGFTYKL